MFDSYSEAEGEEGQGALHVSMRVPVAKMSFFWKLELEHDDEQKQ